MARAHVLSSARVAAVLCAVAALPACRTVERDAFVGTAVLPTRVETHPGEVHHVRAKVEGEAVEGEELYGYLLSFTSRTLWEGDAMTEIRGGFRSVVFLRTDAAESPIWHAWLIENNDGLARYRLDREPEFWRSFAAATDEERSAMAVARPLIGTIRIERDGPQGSDQRLAVDVATADEGPRFALSGVFGPYREHKVHEIAMLPLVPVMGAALIVSGGPYP